MYKPPFTISNYMLQKVMSITEKVSQISIYNAIERMPILRRNNRILSVHSSLAIEANSFSLNQVRDVINGKQVLGPLKEIQEVKNAYQVYELIDSFDGYNQKDLLRAHKILTTNLIDESGQYRNHGEGVFDGEKLIFMAPPHDLIPKLMNDLFDWLKNDDETPVLIKSCVFHYEFVFIHPFSDGNGRTARLWQNVILSKWNKLFEYMPIESQIKKYQDEYYQAIAKCHSNGDSNIFIEFMLRMIDETLLIVLSTSQKESRNISLPSEK